MRDGLSDVSADIFAMERLLQGQKARRQAAGRQSASQIKTRPRMPEQNVSACIGRVMMLPLAHYEAKIIYLSLPAFSRGCCCR